MAHSVDLLLSNMILLLTLVLLRMCRLSLTNNEEDCLCLVHHPSQTKAGVTFLQLSDDRCRVHLVVE